MRRIGVAKHLDDIRSDEEAVGHRICSMYVFSRVSSSLLIGRESFASAASKIRGVSSPVTMISGEKDICVSTQVCQKLDALRVKLTEQDRRDEWRPPFGACKIFPERQYLFRQRTADAGRCAEMLSYNGIEPRPMRCPKCQFDHPLQTTECLKCGIVFSRHKPMLEGAANHANPNAPMAMSTLAVPAPPTLAEPATAASDAHRGSDDLSDVRADAWTELKYRIFALPAALLLARLVAGTGLRMVAAMLAMVLHESGHAITAWLTGRWACRCPGLPRTARNAPG